MNETKVIDTREADLMRKGKECYQRADYKRAQMIFSEVVDVNSKNPEAFFFLGNIFHLSGEVGKAIKAFQSVLSIDPAHTDASISLSVLYNDIGRYEDAKKVFDRASERVKTKSQTPGSQDPHINKKFAHKHYELADLYMSYNRYDDALFEYNKSIGLDSDNLEARVKVAKVYAKKGFNSKAFDELKKLKNEHPAYHPARVALGVLYYGNGNVIEAQAEWKKVLSMDSHNQEAAMYLNLAKTATETTVF